jgi:hypothetical protein
MKTKTENMDMIQYNTVSWYLDNIANGLNVARGYALIGAMVLIGIWLTGRMLEGVNGKTVFDPSLTLWLGVCIFCLLLICLIGFVITSMRNLAKANKQRWAIAAWVFFLILISSILFNFKGFQLSSSALFAALFGSTESMQQQSFLLFKFHSANPMLALNLLAANSRGGVDIQSLSPYVWHSNTLFAFFIWSFAYSILLLTHKDRIWPKIIHLFFSACGLGVMILLKSSSITNEQMIFMHASTVTFLIFQVLLTYSIIRGVGIPDVETPAKPDASAAPSQVEQPKRAKAPLGLPPTALRFALCVFILLPILADLQTQLELAPASARMMSDMAALHKQTTVDRIAVTSVSVHAGPAFGDDILGVLPKDSRIVVQDTKYGWVNIGGNRWIPEKFLRPSVIAVHRSNK